MKLAEIYLELKHDIDLIEQELERSVIASSNTLTEASTHILKAGGKRLRPILVLLGGQFGDYQIEELKHIAVPLELVHMASLVHDDVIDDADLRRGKPTIKAKWDNRVAMYTGDFIFGQAVEIATHFKNPEIHLLLANVMFEMSIGEVEQIRDQYNWEQNLRVYLRRIRRKTALLIAVSCKLGALAANAERAIQRNLYEFGYNVGMSFQITDDILDFVGTEKQLGKPAGSDLLQGNLTVPALYAMHCHQHIKDMIYSKVSREMNLETDMTEIINEIKQSGGIEYSLDLSDRYLKKALKALSSLPNIKAKTHLQQVAEYIGKRKF